MNPIHDQDFLKWLRNRRQKKRLEKRLEKLLEKRQKKQLEKRQQDNQDENKNDRYKAIAFYKIKQNRIWCIIKNLSNVHSKNPPPYPIKVWFFN